MKLDDFISALQDHGWDAVADAQHSKIKDLHKSLFPVVASLEAELEDLEDEIISISERVE